MECIDLNQLLTTGSEESPSGVDLEYDPLFGDMERAAKGKEEQQFGDTLIAAEEPEWHKLRSSALAVLELSKDLRAAVQLTRALIHTDGYAGLAAGLTLIRHYVDGFWESLYPRLDPEDHNDPTIRLNTLLNLCDPVDFLLPITRLPLVNSHRMGQFSLRDIQIANGTITDEESQVSLEQIDAAFREADLTASETLRALIRQSSEALTGITATVDERIGTERSLDLLPIASLLNSAESELASRSLSGNAMTQDDAHTTGNRDSITIAARNNPPAGAVNSRDDVIRSLDRICRYYAQHEPSSPVPLLLQRAKRLVTMGFHEIVQDLAPDGKSHFDFLWRQGDG